MEPSSQNYVTEKILAIVRASSSWDAAKQRILRSFGDTYLELAREEGRRVHGFDWVTDPLPSSTPTGDLSLSDVVWIQNLVHDSGSWSDVMAQVRKRLGASRLHDARRIAKETRGIAWVHEQVDPNDPHEERVRKKLMALDDSTEELRAAGLEASPSSGNEEAPDALASRPAHSPAAARAAAPSPEPSAAADPQAQFLERSKREQDDILHRRIPELGFEIHAASAGTAVNWSAVQEIASQTAAGKKLLLRSAIEKAVAFFIGIGLFFTSAAWWLCLLLCVLLVGYAFWHHVVLTRRAAGRAASSDVDAFGTLWNMGAIALYRPAVNDHYSNRPTPTRWQDVVLYALDWDALATDAPIGRKEAMAKVLDGILPQREPTA
ncbi:hypothetical protein LJR290_007644 [Variovorax sp. LjRoot290]|uniref:hypothetical protein n=1 Tax=Variovorax sp. LjRoot290 TaxID=3342316 RepID=UPI003ED105A1